MTASALHGELSIFSCNNLFQIQHQGLQYNNEHSWSDLDPLPVAATLLNPSHWLSPRGLLRFPPDIPVNIHAQYSLLTILLRCLVSHYARLYNNSLTPLPVIYPVPESSSHRQMAFYDQSWTNDLTYRMNHPYGGQFFQGQQDWILFQYPPCTHMTILTYSESPAR